MEPIVLFLFPQPLRGRLQPMSVRVNTNTDVRHHVTDTALVLAIVVWTVHRQSSQHVFLYVCYSSLCIPCFRDWDPAVGTFLGV